jgi:hypothetical protein
MKVKDFIFCVPHTIEGMQPIRMAENEYGRTENFYLINNSNVNELRKTFQKGFKENKEVDFKWYINRWAVAIVDKGYLMNNFLKKDQYQLLKTWTTREITL